MTQQAELLQKIDTLPPEYLDEVIDFVGYLQQKARRETSQAGKCLKEPPSKQFAGALKLSEAVYETLQNSLQEGRNEWNRNIF
ncbi:MAG TPA: hypothetical protein DEQ14_06120 [Treponema sp.]|nr:hypothetical protein [Treponema sp.]